ncbi:MotA/TolQ/ExbB proton channel family protein [Anaplasma capra]|uniref:MotA/TolQ/ExbB proton channel family protein n=1 Tax=Anaplasma capra TaxID=1562740 RepID=UPI0021D60440|nr:MotA/TolQ/ExbB proton channel family protein [Anaplasma capra]MCU7611381.1 MotA/TolQ/ExbB proton channel family protein [Anaplasma capra]MCU7612455.1 MotA/TolQ/ExbB proton channel family protein [Anaplasma capra]
MKGVVESSIGMQGGLSILSAFSNADIVVKAVVLVLVAFSIVSWSVILKKHLMLRKQVREIKELEERFSSRRTFTNLAEIVGNSTGIVSHILNYGMKNSQLVANKRDGLHRFVSAELSRTLDKLEDSIELLATIGSSSPFIGLLGTVWGVVGSLRAIPVGASVGIASVGPGVSEALFATALGLLVAIPANIFYNRFTALITRISNRLSNLVYELEAFADYEE